MVDDDNNNRSSKKKKSFKEKSSQQLRSCGKFMWNKEDRTCMGRTGLGWIKILGFYLCFYAAIAALWAVCMAVFLQTLDPNAPTQQHKYSMLKDNPGMGLWPAKNASDSTLIYFSTNVSSTYSYYTNSLSTLLSGYTNTSTSELFMNCDSGADNANFSVACAFDIGVLGSQCTAENQFGYSSCKPCILLRINKIYDWQPASVLFNGSNINNNGSNEWQFAQIRNGLKSKYIPNANNSYIPVSCEGENDGDTDNIRSITFTPEYGFPASYFPYENQLNYMPPAVMAQFDVEPGRAIMIWCKIWVANIQHDLTDLQGSIHLELFVMNNCNE